MGEVLIGGLRPPSVALGALKTARPVYGRLSATLAVQAGVALGYVGMRVVLKAFEMSRPSDDGLGASMRTDWRTPISLGPYGSHLFVGGWIYAEEGSVKPSMDLSVETLAGAVIDGPLTFSQANGQLPVRPVVTTAVAATAGATADNDDFWHTPWRRDGAGARLMDVSGREGQQVSVRIQTTNVRIYSLLLLQAYKERIG